MVYMLTASDSENDLPVFPILHPASRHDSLGFASTFFTMRAFLPDYTVSKLLLDSAHDAMPVYEYCRKEHIHPFIDLNVKRGIRVKYKDDLPSVVMVYPSAWLASKCDTMGLNSPSSALSSVAH